MLQPERNALNAAAPNLAGGTTSLAKTIETLQAQVLALQAAQTKLQAGPKVAVANGGAAGDITIAGIAVGDVLQAVLYFPISTGTVTSVSNLTSEFTILAGKINNTGGTVTTAGKLVVIFNDLSA